MIPFIFISLSFSTHVPQSSMKEKNYYHSTLYEKGMQSNIFIGKPFTALYPALGT